MHRLRSLLLIALPALGLAGPLGCSSSNNAGGATSSAADGGTGTGTTPANSEGGTTSPLAAGQGNPCRGTALPTDASYVPAGFCAVNVATGADGVRQLGFAPNGDLFATSAGGQIWLYRDDNGDGVYQKAERHDWASTGGNGSNAFLDVAGGFVYSGSPDKVQRFAYVAGQMTAASPASDVVVGIPSGGNHPKHTTRLYDGWLYVQSGSSGNASHESGSGASDYDTQRSLIKRFDMSKFVPGTPLQWSAGEPFTVGLRNPVGFIRSETTKKIFAVVNGMDDQVYGPAVDNIHQDNPGEQVLELASGKKYGFPFCFTAQRLMTKGLTGDPVTPGTQLINVNYQGNPHDDAWCAANSSPPATFIQAHSAPLDIAFFDTQPTGGLPEEYRNGAFVALHGSWDRDNPTGHKVVWIPFGADGYPTMPTSAGDATTFPYKVVFGGGSAAGGPKDGPWTLDVQGITESPVRPAGLAISPIDGALYIASDSGGDIYRIGKQQ